MAILALCGADGLLKYRYGWEQITCPLPSPTLLAQSGSLLAMVDVPHRLLWMGEKLFPVDPGIEALQLWQGHPLLLSGDTDCIMLLDPHSGSPLVLTPVGVYPQDMCLMPGNMVAVCGGAEGTVHLLHLPELTILRTIRVPGNAQRITWQHGWLYVLCAAEDDGLCCLLCRCHPQAQRYEPLDTLPGLPGALHGDGRGLWAAASESLYYFPDGKPPFSVQLGGFGLIRHIDCQDGLVLTTDPLMGQIRLIHREQGQVLLEGDAQEARFLRGPQHQ